MASYAWARPERTPLNENGWRSHPLVRPSETGETGETGESGESGESGSAVLPGRWQFAGRFRDGLAAVLRGDQWGMARNDN